MKLAGRAGFLHRRVHMRVLFVCMAALLFLGTPATSKAASYSSITSDTTLSNGDTISGSISGCTLTIPAGATVNVTGKISVSGTVNIVGGGTLIRGNSFTGASMLEVTSGAVLNIGTSGTTGVTISGNSMTMAFNGGGIYVNGGTLNLYSGATVSNHLISKSNGMGGGIYVNAGTLNLYDGSLVTSNKATVTSAYGGGGIAINEGATFNMYGGTISGNSAPCTAGGTGGGGVYTKGTFNMYGGTISGNTSGRNGGAVHIDGGTGTTGSPVMTMTGGLISGNSAMFGGGIEILAKATLNISAGKINSNTCTVAGGGIELDASGYSGSLNIRGSAEVTGNTKSGAQNNILIDKNLSVVGNFTGSVGVVHETSSYNNAGQTFGTANGSYTGMENFFCDGKTLVGTLSGTNVIWKSSSIALTGIALSTNSPVTGTVITTTLSPSGSLATYQWYRSVTTSNSGGTIIIGATESSYTPTSADVGKHLYVVANGTGGCTGIVTSSATTSAAVYSVTVATPTFSVSSGTYFSTQNVEIFCSTSGADIYYTTNGGTPTSASTKYTGSIAVSSTTTLKAIAIKSDCADSSVASVTYTISAVTATPYAGTYDSTAHDAVTLAGVQPGDTVAYSEDAITYLADCPRYTDAGSYSVYVKVTRSGSGNWESGKQTVVIGKATGSIVFNGDPSKIFDGNPVSDPSVSSVGSGTITYSYYADSSGSIGSKLSGAPSAIGTYWVKAAIAESANYTADEATLTFTIDAVTVKTVSIDVDSSSSVALIKLYDASVTAMSGDADVYIDDVFVAAVTVETSGYSYSLSGLTSGNHTIKAVAASGVFQSKAFTVAENPPIISSNPVDKSVVVGNKAAFHVTASSPVGGSLIYQWQINRGSGWNDISDATDETYTTSEVELLNDGYQYRVVIQSVTGSITSSVATLHVFESVDVPSTGDTAQPGLWLCLGIVSLAGLVVIPLLHRKQRS